MREKFEMNGYGPSSDEIAIILLKNLIFVLIGGTPIALGVLIHFKAEGEMFFGFPLLLAISTPLAALYAYLKGQKSDGIFSEESTEFLKLAIKMIVEILLMLPLAEWIVRYTPQFITNISEAASLEEMENAWLDPDKELVWFQPKLGQVDLDGILYIFCYFMLFVIVTLILNSEIPTKNESEFRKKKKLKNIEFLLDVIEVAINKVAFRPEILGTFASHCTWGEAGEWVNVGGSNYGIKGHMKRSLFALPRIIIYNIILFLWLSLAVILFSYLSGNDWPVSGERATRYVVVGVLTLSPFVFLLGELIVALIVMWKFDGGEIAQRYSLDKIYLQVLGVLVVALFFLAVGVSVEIKVILFLTMTSYLCMRMAKIKKFYLLRKPLRQNDIELGGKCSIANQLSKIQVVENSAMKGLVGPTAGRGWNWFARENLSRDRGVEYVFTRRCFQWLTALYVEAEAAEQLDRISFRSRKFNGK